MYSKALLLLSGNAATSLLALLRNLLVARLLPVEDYGIAATFAVVMALIEMVSAFGLQQQIIQSKRADPEWQAALQGFQLLRAVISSLVLFLAAGPIATFLGVPDIAWAYQVLAVAPLLNGLIHFDIYRLTRSMRYLPGILSTTLPALIGLLLAWPLWALLGDFRVMLYLVLIQTGLMAAISLMVAERPFRVRLERSAIAGVIQFGWPLLINNALLFLVLNGEKALVGRELGMAALAIFAMGFTLTLTPTLVIAKSVQSFFLPQLSAVQEDDTRFQPLARTTIEVNLLNGMLLVGAVMLLGPPFIDIVLGEKYAALVPLLTWLAILQALRVFKAGGAVVSLARAKTENAMVANLFRVLSLPLSWWAAIETGDILLVIWIATAGEFLGVCASLLLVRIRAGVALAPLKLPLLACAAFLIAAAAHAAHPAMPALATLPRWAFLAACLALLTVSIWSMADARAFLKARTVQIFEA